LHFGTLQEEHRTLQQEHRTLQQEEHHMRNRAVAAVLRTGVAAHRPAAVVHTAAVHTGTVGVLRTVPWRRGMDLEPGHCPSY
jgi:hypothetical protein